MDLCLNLLILLISFNGFKYSMSDKYDQYVNCTDVDTNADKNVVCAISRWPTDHSNATDDEKCCTGMDLTCAVIKSKTKCQMKDSDGFEKASKKHREDTKRERCHHSNLTQSLCQSLMPTTDPNITDCADHQFTCDFEDENTPPPTDMTPLPTDMTPLPTDMTPLPTDMTPLPTAKTPEPVNTITTPPSADPTTSSQSNWVNFLILLGIIGFVIIIVIISIIGYFKFWTIQESTKDSETKKSKPESDTNGEKNTPPTPKTEREGEKSLSDKSDENEKTLRD